MARVFDGNVANYLYTDNIPSSSRPITIACWFNTSSLSANKTLVFFGDKDAISLVNQYTLRLLTSGQIQFLYADGTSSGTVSSGAVGTYSVNQWAFAAGIARTVPTRNTAVLNNKGFPGGGSFAYSPTTPDRIAIGVNVSTDIEPFNGSIAEVAIWNTSFDTIASLEPLYSRNISPLLVRPQNLIFYAPLIRGEDMDLFGGSLSVAGSISTGDHLKITRPSTQLVR